MWKLVVFWLGAGICVPLGFVACQLHQSVRYLIFAIMFFSLLTPETFSINFLSEEYYKMATRGFEIHLVDLAALILLLDTLFHMQRRPIKWFPPLTMIQFSFIIVATISWSLVEGAKMNPMIFVEDNIHDPTIVHVFNLSLYPLFEITKLLRGYLVYWVTVNTIRSQTHIQVFKFCIAVVLIYLTVNSLYMRYGLGVHRVAGGIGHFINFNTFVGLLGAFILPWAYYTRRVEKSVFYWFLILCVLICIILSISRTALAGFGLVLMFGVPVLSYRFLSTRNALFTIIFCLGAFVLSLKAADSLFKRFQLSEPTHRSLSVRNRINNAAKMMAADFPFGVGMGNFSAWSTLKYADLAEAEKGNFAHNTFYLTMAETGYLGFLLFVCLWLRYVQVLGKALFSRYVREDPFWFCTLFGVILGMLFLVLQLWFQFTYRVTPVYMLVQMLMGIGTRVYVDSRALEPGLLSLKKVRI